MITEFRKSEIKSKEGFTMERNYGAEIDELKKELQKLSAWLSENFCEKWHSPCESEETKTKKVGHVKKIPSMHPDPSVMAIMDNLENVCGEEKNSGRITYMGVFSSGGKQSEWVCNGVNTDQLLTLIEDGTAEKVLACIGSRDRLNLLLMLLERPMTVAQLLEEGGYHSTGQVYHHLRPLLAADLVAADSTQAEKGRYCVRPYRVQGIIMLLAGISDMVNPQHTQGCWEEPADDTPLA